MLVTEGLLSYNRREVRVICAASDTVNVGGGCPCDFLVNLFNWSGNNKEKISIPPGPMNWIEEERKGILFFLLLLLPLKSNVISEGAIQRRNWSLLMRT